MNSLSGAHSTQATPCLEAQPALVWGSKQTHSCIAHPSKSYPLNVPQYINHVLTSRPLQFLLSLACLLSCTHGSVSHPLRFYSNLLHNPLSFSFSVFPSTTLPICHSCIYSGNSLPCHRHLRGRSGICFHISKSRVFRRRYITIFFFLN